MAKFLNPSIPSNSLRPNAVRLDEISLQLIKRCFPLILSTLTHNNSTKYIESFPDAWKCSKIVPEAKIKNQSRFKDYRPINILKKCALHPSVYLETDLMFYFDLNFNSSVSAWLINNHHH
jgi:hypothetical protein